MEKLVDDVWRWLQAPMPIWATLVFCWLAYERAFSYAKIVAKAVDGVAATVERETADLRSEIEGLRG
jgi:hypothetical protein